jgi:hypothetical protein
VKRRTCQVWQTPAKRRDLSPAPLSVRIRRTVTPRRRNQPSAFRQEGRPGAAALRPPDFDEGHARRIVDRDVDVLVPDDLEGQAPGLPVRPRRPIRERLGPARQPLGDGADTHTRRLRGLALGPALTAHTVDEHLSLIHVVLRITMERHFGRPSRGNGLV